jgi:hypothetical protein
MTDLRIEQPFLVLQGAAATHALGLPTQRPMRVTLRIFAAGHRANACSGSLHASMLLAYA